MRIKKEYQPRIKLANAKSTLPSPVGEIKFTKCCCVTNLKALEEPFSPHMLYYVVFSFSLWYDMHKMMQLSQIMAEHVRSPFLKGVTKTVNSAILRHLADSEHQIDPGTILKTAIAINIKIVNKRFLMTAKSVLIRLLKPMVWKQLNRVQPLLLSRSRKWTRQSLIWVRSPTNKFYFACSPEFLRSHILTHSRLVLGPWKSDQFSDHRISCFQSPVTRGS